MKDNRILTKTRIGEYVEVEYTGANTSGRIPVGDQVLVLPYKAPEKTAGGILIPESIAETNSLAAETGVVVDVGDGAWTWNMDRTRRFTGAKPEIGDRVNFTRYSGLEVIGDDGQMYRVMADNCILAIVGTKEADIIEVPLSAA